ncbi:hypothetical protein G7066_04840 [Leucobacter coleopterorum]|uniref:Uncharacterized protein n=1 Tax=Leucobacter coleopterorum TaxID=2714933 RepID=A0ABX6JYY8_9MICO|nr:hypothetical protein [Leucobacter coleopterorum]QIM18154.1 hypothetical protein G7066_04840 [Leucobacter coleopterorum]
MTVPATAYAVATAPQQSSAASAIARGQAAHEKQQRDGGNKPDPHSQGDKTTEIPTAFEGQDISAVGDSVMLASLPELSSGLPGIEIDAAVSRGLEAGIDVVSDLVSQGALRDVVVVGLGTNGPINTEELEVLRDVVGPRPLVLVNAHGERDWIPGSMRRSRSTPAHTAA